MTGLIELTSFEIVGVPAPQGSKSVMPNGHAVEGSSTSGRQKHAAWRDTVAWMARQHAETTPHNGALALGAMFRFPMPKTRPKYTHELGVAYHVVKPDLDKLIRALLDGLKAGGLIADDARICQLDAGKIEVTGWTGAELTLWRCAP